MNKSNNFEFDFSVNEEMNPAFKEIVDLRKKIEATYGASVSSVKKHCSEVRKQYGVGSDDVQTGWTNGGDIDEYAAKLIKLEVGLKEFTASLMRLAPDQNKVFKTNHVKRILENTNRLILIENVDTFINTCIDMSMNYPIGLRILGICGLTGRRPYEVGVCGTFRQNEKGEMVFGGQAKTKTAECPEYVIPVLGDVDHIIACVNSIRRDPSLQDLDSVSFHNRFSRGLARFIKNRMTGVYETGFEPMTYSLRGSYATICYKKFCEPHIHNTRYYSTILGHGEMDINTGESYAKFYIND